MATTTLGHDSARVIRPQQFPPAAAGRIAASLLNRHSAHEIADAVEVLVDVLDLIGGDSDVEANGDELDFNGAEDDFEDYPLSHTDMGAGCPISDPGEDEHDREQDAGDL
jgi:hypothetical protein